MPHRKCEKNHAASYKTNLMMQTTQTRNADRRMELLGFRERPAAGTDIRAD